MRYYISDLHFFHDKLNEQMDRRGFSSREAMHDHMISRWNARVRNNDEVMILGDFSVGRAKETMEILDALHGKKYLVRGNHDYFVKEKDFEESRFMWIEKYKEVHDHKRKVIMSHYPIFCYNGQYSADEQGRANTYMLYGHVHDSYDEVLVNRFIHQTRAASREIRNKEIHIPCQMINCFCMYSDYTPLTLDEWICVDQKRREMLVQRSDS